MGQKEKKGLRIRSCLIGQVSELGGGSWDVYGLQDQGFSNDVS